MANRKKAADEPVGVKIRVGDEWYFFDRSRCSGEDILTLRKKTGFSVQRVMDLFQEDPDNDLIAIVVWLARRQGGERTLQLDDVLRSITYATELDITTGTEDANESLDPDDPES